MNLLDMPCCGAYALKLMCQPIFCMKSRYVLVSIQSRMKHYQNVKELVREELHQMLQTALTSMVKILGEPSERMKRMKNQWQVQEAKKHFREVIEKAVHEGPQVITRRGVETVMIVSVQEYQNVAAPETGLVEFFRNSPFYAVSLDLERNKDTAREVEL